jgi:hypothetical protein
MNLIHYYREQFTELTSQFEQTWEEEPQYRFGFLWHSNANAAFKEKFQMTQTSEEPLHLMYAIELPESYIKTNICEAIKHVKTTYELSMYVFSHKIMLTTRVSIDQLQMTSLGFINQARAEIIDLLFSSIQVTECEYI